MTDKTNTNNQASNHGQKRIISEKVKDEEQIYKQNKFLRSVIESLTCPFYVIDANHYKIKMANSALSKDRKAEGLTCHQYFYQKDNPCGSIDHICSVDHVRTTREPLVVGHKQSDPQGRARYIEYHSYPVFDEKGQVSQIVEYQLDITERAESEQALESAEKALSKTERQLQTLANNFPDFIARFDKKGRFLYVNGAITRSFGLPLEKIIGRTLHELPLNGGSVEQNNILFAGIKQAFEQGVPNTIEAHWSTNRGERAFEVRHIPEKDEHDKVISVLGITRDITGHKKAEQALERAKEAAELIFRLVPSAVFTVEMDGTISSVNERFCEVTGYSENEVVGSKCFDFFLEPCKENCDLCSGRIQSPIIGKECKVRAKDGKILTICKNAVLLRDSGGNSASVIESFENITESKRLEQRQKDLLGELESVNRELKDFAYIISHDLKAPLRGIATLVEWISTDYADVLDREGREQMELLVNRVKKMHSMIDGVLQYSRVGRIREEKQNVNLNELVSEVIGIVNPPDNVHIEVADNLPEIKFEPTRIMQLFQNLMSNAVKYIEKEQGYMKISFAEEGENLKFEIEDNGRGIRQEDYDRIFQIFQTVGHPEKVESTGIGLTVVKKIIELYGGQIGVRSEVGEGTTFFFTLPKSEVGVKDNEKLEANITG